jgi:MGT family glycosyltransferase
MHHRNAHIAFIIFPHPPHVNPTLPVVSVLVRRGYRVSYVTSERFAGQITALGAEIVPCSPFLTPFSGMEWKDVVDRELEVPVTVRLARLMLNEITRFYEESKPDLIVYDFMALAGRILAHTWRIPAIQTSPTFAREATDRFEKMADVLDAAEREKWRQYSAKVAEFVASHGIRAEGVPFHENLNVHWFPRIFQPTADVFGPRFFYAGRCAGEQTAYGDWQPKEADRRPIVLIGTSTTYTQGPDYFRTCIEGLRGFECRIAIYAGDKFDAAFLTELPEHCEVVRNVSQLRLFRYASLLICHGGIITPAEAAYYGVPLLMTTHAVPELEMQAEIFEKIGLGIHLRKADATAENIGISARRLMTDVTTQEKIEKIRRDVVREPGAEETVNRIEEYLEGETRLA